MAIFSDPDRKRIKELLSDMENPVRLVHFTQELECPLCRETKQLLDDLVGLSGKLSLETYNLQLDSDKASTYRVDKAPATLVIGAKDYGVRLYGIPAGYEIVVLLESILRVSQGKSGLEQDSIEKLKNLKSPLHIEVFVTPTCPYCPGAARVAHQMAIESNLISADTIEATEFPELAGQYRVRGVPKTVVNGAFGIEGSLPEAEFVEEILRAAGSRTAPAPSDQ